MQFDNAAEEYNGRLAEGDQTLTTIVVKDVCTYDIDFMTTDYTTLELLATVPNKVRSAQFTGSLSRKWWTMLAQWLAVTTTLETLEITARDIEFVTDVRPLIDGVLHNSTLIELNMSNVILFGDHKAFVDEMCKAIGASRALPSGFGWLFAGSQYGREALAANK